MKFLSAIALLCISSASGFVQPSGPTQSTALHMTPQEGLKKAAVSFVAAAFLASNLAVVEPAMAIDDMNMDFGSSQVLAGRSGGRAGGRSSSYRAPSRPSSSSSVRSTKVIQRNTYVQPSPIILSPPVYGYGYNPVPGLGKNLSASVTASFATSSLVADFWRLSYSLSLSGLSLGLNAINQIGNDMRDYRQESEIAQARAQLQNSQVREAELESRIRQLEMANQNNQLSQQQQQQLMQLQMLNQQLQESK